jgi:M6 family metalloprotease-like protein
MVPKKIILLVLTALLPLCVLAQEEWEVRHGGCLPTGLPQHSYANSSPLLSSRRLPAINDQWDATRVYKQAVILIEFDELTDDTSDDTKFTTENPAEYYDRLFNEPGFSERHSKGCVADYYREQSGGLLNLSFDVYGPITVHQKAQPYDEPDARTRNYGRESFVEATKKVIDATPDINWKQYDWNGDGYVNQIIYVYACYSGNTGQTSYGYIWPNTSTFSAITAPDGTKIRDYSSSGERWPTSSVILCGLGTICHEFTHSLGLPDLYRTDISDNVILDMWDLMDGGNYTNYGFCPPNYTPMEKILLGWKEPEELTEPTTVQGLEYGKVYKISNTENDYYLLENRVQQGWDEGAPGKGLCVYHVLWDEEKWRKNTVNNGDVHAYTLVHADGLDYYQWIKLLGGIKYAKNGMMNCLALSTTPFPYLPPEDDAVTSFELVEDKPVTNIQLDSDGKISFDFKGGATGIRSVNTLLSPYTYYDLQGCGVENPVRGQLYIVRRADGSMCKSIYR